MAITKYKKMNRNTFISEITKLIKIGLALNVKAVMYGITSLEDEVEDLDDEDYKIGLRMIIDGEEAAKVDEFYTKILTAKKDKHTQVYKTIIKKLVLGTLALKDTKKLYNDLLSCADLTDKEQKEIDKNNLADIALNSKFIISEAKPPIPDNVESDLSFDFEDIGV